MPPARSHGRPHLYLVEERSAVPEPPPPPPTADPHGLFTSLPSPDEPPDLERDLAFIDQVLAIQPVPQDVLVWRAVAPGAFELPWRELPGTLHQELSYLAVALVHYQALGAAEAVLHLRVPAGVPGVYLNPFDHGDRLPAPTLLLGRGLALFVHEVRRQDGQWYVRADLVPPPPAGWRERPRSTTATSDATDRGTAGAMPGPARETGRQDTRGVAPDDAHDDARVVDLAKVLDAHEGGAHGC